MSKKISDDVSPSASTAFITKVSHELKSPIHGILGVCGYLLENWDLVEDNKKKECLNELKNAADSLNFLVLSLLRSKHPLVGMSNGEIKFDFTKLDFRDILLEVLESMKIFLLHKSDLKTELEIAVNNSSCEIMIDRLWFKQLLSNILVNAIKFSSKGTIKLRVSENTIEDKDYYLFSISDEGKGVIEKEMPLIFDPFNKASGKADNVSGTGLGLSICKEVVEAHGGSIKGYNNSIGGFTVEFTIPKGD